MKPVPPSVTDPRAIELYQRAQALRAQLKEVAESIDGLVADSTPGEHVHRQVIANATLAFRHAEDASHRLGKVLQHLDGGVSVYDRATTVGA